jgi:hypothetical protein
MEDTTQKRPGRPPRSHRSPSLIAKAMSESTETVAKPEELAEIVKDASPGIPRPTMRPTMREEDPREAAARRAAEIRGHLGGAMDDGVDEFRAPPAPEGWEYEWKARMVMGQEQHSYMTGLARTGWEPVPTSRYPDMMPSGGNHPTIERKGQVLMMRPKVISDEVRDGELRKARNQVKAKQEQLTHAPEGHFERSSRDTKSTKHMLPFRSQMNDDIVT